MPLFWIAHRIDDVPHVRIEEASALVFARLAASMAGFDPRNFSEAFALDDRMARKVPKGMIGRELRQGEAKKLLERIG